MADDRMRGRAAQQSCAFQTDAAAIRLKLDFCRNSTTALGHDAAGGRTLLVAHVAQWEHPSTGPDCGMPVGHAWQTCHVTRVLPSQRDGTGQSKKRFVDLFFPVAGRPNL